MFQFLSHKYNVSLCNKYPKSDQLTFKFGLFTEFGDDTTQKEHHQTSFLTNNIKYFLFWALKCVFLCIMTQQPTFN